MIQTLTGFILMAAGWAVLGIEHFLVPSEVARLVLCLIAMGLSVAAIIVIIAAVLRRIAAALRRAA